MAMTDRAALIREYYRSFNLKDFDLARSLLAPDARLTIVPFGLTVPNLELMGLWATAFPDGRTDVSRIIAEGDAVAVEYLGSGTHAGEFKLPWGSLPPTNRRAELHFIDVHRITNGRIAESRHYFDVLSMCGQLGVDPRVMVREPIAVGSST